METITVPIGPNMSIDGGPFENFRADGIDGETDPESGKLVDVESGLDADIELIEEAVRTDMLDAQPLHLTTGDADEVVVGEVEVPLKTGYTVEIHGLSGQGKDLIAHLDNLVDDELRHSHFEKKLKSHGGAIEG